MQEYPKMLYKDGGSLEVDGHFYSHVIVNDLEQEKSHLKSGWKHKAVQGEGLDEQYKLEAENEALKAKLAMLEAKEEVKEPVEKVVETVVESELFEPVEEVKENPAPRRGRKSKG